MAASFRAGVSMRMTGAAMKHETSQVLFTYWNKVRAGRFAPNRFDIEPSRIADVLPETLIIERHEGDRYQFRLAGTRICERFGREFRGTNFLDLFDAEDTFLVTRKLGVMARQGAVGIFNIQSKTTHGHEANAELALMPLLHAEGQVDRFVGSLSVCDPPGWLGALPLIKHKIIAHELIWPQGHRWPNDGRTVTLDKEFMNDSVSSGPHCIEDFATKVADSEKLHRENSSTIIFDGEDLDDPDVISDPIPDEIPPLTSNVRHARIVKSDRCQFRVYDGGRT